MTIAYPDDALAYRPFPVDADNGFPQTFRFAIDGATYVATIGVTWLDPATVLEPDDTSIVELPDPATGLALTLRIDTGESDGDMLALRRIVRDRPLAFGPLRIRFNAVSIAMLNLRDPGSAGSLVDAEIAVTA